MKQYLKEVLLYFLVPAALIAIVAEYSLRSIPNDYALKNRWLTANSRDVEVLALGASSVLHDIDPRYLQKRGFNAAHLSQSLKYDHLIFNKFIDQMPSLEYVIMGIDYWTPFGDIEESPEWWRVKYYNIHYGGKFYRWEGRYNYELYFRDIGSFKRAGNGLLTLLGMKDETHVTIDDRGYGTQYTLDNRSAEWDNGEVEASRHNALIADGAGKNRIEQNRQYVEEIIKKSAERNVVVMLVIVPLYQSYRDNQDREFVNQQKAFCDYFAENYLNVLFYDFSADPRFKEDDFYDANHLNEEGTKKFTLLLDSIMANPSTPLLTKNLLEK